ncbi:MAG: hypothetical protein CME70_16345 [Halobacteriovorax sp.]|nr:hypothetical protein [Halobacteriovorax sp.]|tara:strand:+ start:5448 stop:7247 length:1800 start_codon:yes stop_codon:yes gene_type:complete
MKAKYIISLLILLIFGTGFLLAPGLIKDKLITIMSENIDSTVYLDELEINPFSAEITLIGLSIGEKSEVLELKKLVLRPDLLSLFSKEKVVKSLTIEGLVLKAIPKLKARNEKIKKSNSTLKFKLNELKLKEIKLSHFLIPLNKDLSLSNALIHNIDIEGKKLKANLKRAKIKIHESEIDLSLNFRLVKEPSGKGTIKIKNFNLEFLEHKKLKEKIKNLGGELSLNLALELKNKVVTSTGEVELKKLNYLPESGAQYQINSLWIKKDFSYSHEKTVLDNAELKLQGLTQSSKEEAVKRIKGLLISNLNLKKEAGSNFDLAFDVNKYGKINFEKKQESYKGKIKNLDLSKFSNFLVLDEESQVGSGKLFLNLKGKVKKDNQLSGDLKLFMAQLEIEKSGDKDISLISTSRAVSLIKDKNGKIEIESKITGSLDDPSFNLIYFLSKGVGNVLAEKFYSLLAVEAAKKVAPLLLSSIPINPLNAISLFKKGYDLAVKPRFAAMNFPPHEEKLKDRELKVLDRILNFLKKESEISLSFCVDTYLKEGDSTLSLEKARSLRIKRSAFISQYIVKKAPRVESQVVFCSEKAKIEDSGNASLEVEL